jgi:hypothetical protein
MNRKRNEDKAKERHALPVSGQCAPSESRFVFKQPHIVHATAVYTVDDLRRVFGLKSSSVRREVRLKRLRIAKRCGRYFCIGQWVLEWLGNGELKPSAGPGKANADRIEQDGRSI